MDVTVICRGHFYYISTTDDFLFYFASLLAVRWHQQVAGALPEQWLPLSRRVARRSVRRGAR